MNSIVKPVALLGLFLTLLAPLLLFFGTIDSSPMKIMLTIGMILWYLGATPWLGIGHKEEIPGEDTRAEI